MPTGDENCVLIDYATCVLNTINYGVIQEHNCSLGFFPNDLALPYCSDELILLKIKEMKMALYQKEYKNCKDHKSCNVVHFHLTNPENAQFVPMDSGYSNYVEFKIQFEDFIVEEITDSYVYNFIKIFSEIGGALGISVGLSVMSIFQLLANVDVHFTHFLKILFKRPNQLTSTHIQFE